MQYKTILFDIHAKTYEEAVQTSSRTSHSSFGESRSHFTFE